MSTDPQTRHDRLTSRLCWEIDELEWENGQLREEVEALRAELAEARGESLAQAQRGVGLALKFALNFQDDGENLILNPAGRKDIAEHIKSQSHE